MDDELIYQVLAVVNEIPKGNVATYGQIARLVDREKNSRLIGKILRHSSNYGDFPCHRVVNSSGRLVIGWEKQKDLLINEGVAFKSNGNVDLKKYQWEI